MKLIKYSGKVFGSNCSLQLMKFSKSDGKKWKFLFDTWKKLTIGMKAFGARGINVPEGLTESAFCMFSGSNMFLKKTSGKIPTSFDTFNTKTNKAEQIKACSIKKDLTSFGPRSVWDDLYFLDFYNDGKLDGLFDVYKIPNKYILKTNVNKTQLLKDQQIEKRRPRFSLKKDIIQKYKIKPVKSKVKVW